jgi:hypothetical protein
MIAKVSKPVGRQQISSLILAGRLQEVALHNFGLEPFNLELSSSHFFPRIQENPALVTPASAVFVGCSCHLKALYLMI